jgi:hypothetical protein
VASTCRSGNHVGNGLPLASIFELNYMVFFTYLGFSGFGNRKKRRCIDSSEYF